MYICITLKLLNRFYVIINVWLYDMNLTIILLNTFFCILCIGVESWSFYLDILIQAVGRIFQEREGGFSKFVTQNPDLFI